METFIFSGLEAIGMIFSILGSFMASRDERKSTNTVYIAFWMFYISNLAVFLVSLYQGMAPLMIQMIFFMFGSAAVILSRTKNKEKDISIMKKSMFLYIWIVIATLFVKSGSFNFLITPLEIAAALMAVTGSFLFKKKEDNWKLNAFILFFFADILYTYIAYEHGMFFFMAQSVFFIYTSSQGMFNILKYRIIPA